MANDPARNLEDIAKGIKDLPERLAKVLLNQSPHLSSGHVPLMGKPPRQRYLDDVSDDDEAAGSTEKRVGEVHKQREREGKTPWGATKGLASELGGLSDWLQPLSGLAEMMERFDRLGEKLRNFKEAFFPRKENLGTLEGGAALETGPYRARQSRENYPLTVARHPRRNERGALPGNAPPLLPPPGQGVGEIPHLPIKLLPPRQNRDSLPPPPGNPRLLGYAPATPSLGTSPADSDNEGTRANEKILDLLRDIKDLLATSEESQDPGGPEKGERDRDAREPAMEMRLSQTAASSHGGKTPDSPGPARGGKNVGSTDIMGIAADFLLLGLK